VREAHSSLFYSVGATRLSGFCLHHMGVFGVGVPFLLLCGAPVSAIQKYRAVFHCIQYRRLAMMFIQHRNDTVPTADLSRLCWSQTQAQTCRCPMFDYTGFACFVRRPSRRFNFPSGFHCVRFEPFICVLFKLHWRAHWLLPTLPRPHFECLPRRRYLEYGKSVSFPSPAPL